MERSWWWANRRATVIDEQIDRWWICDELMMNRWWMNGGFMVNWRLVMANWWLVVVNHGHCEWQVEFCLSHGAWVLFGYWGPLFSMFHWLWLWDSSAIPVKSQELTTLSPFTNAWHAPARREQDRAGTLWVGHWYCGSKGPRGTHLATCLVMADPY